MCHEFAEFNKKRARKPSFYSVLYRYIKELEVREETVTDFDEKKFA
jgi:hypothetical protein